jgi:hypothetical protein
MKGAPLKSSTTVILPPAPNLLSAMRAGFDAITNHVGLILFPLALDLLLWFSPHLRLTRLIRAFVQQLVAVYQVQDQQMAEVMRSGQEVWMAIAEQLNLLGSLRTYPVGVPSLFLSRMPISSPFGTPGSVEIVSLGGAILAWLLLTLLGLGFGSLYFGAVAQAALNGKVNWQEARRDWSRWFVQVLYLAIFWTALVFVIALPGSIFLSLAVMSGLSLMQCALLIYSAMVAWLVIPLFFSPHGIFVFRLNMRNSVKASVTMTRATMPMTLLFLLVTLLVSIGMNLLWLTPVETSWWMAVGVAGHAFVTTGLLAASFVYYRDAEKWTQRVELQKKMIG